MYELADAYAKKINEEAWAELKYLIEIERSLETFVISTNEV